MSSVREQNLEKLGRSVETLEKPHQVRESYDPHGERYDLKERGFFCAHCKAKCTLGTNGDEYGHQPDCPHRNIDHNAVR